MKHIYLIFPQVFSICKMKFDWCWKLILFSIITSMISSKRLVTNGNIIQNKQNETKQTKTKQKTETKWVKLLFSKPDNTSTRGVNCPLFKSFVSILDTMSLAIPCILTRLVLHQWSCICTIYINYISNLETKMRKELKRGAEHWRKKPEVNSSNGSYCEYNPNKSNYIDPRPLSHIIAEDLPMHLIIYTRYINGSQQTIDVLLILIKSLTWFCRNINLFIYLFKLHITPICVKQLQCKSMQTYKNKKIQKTQT